jgi:hypothetical protein
MKDAEEHREEASPKASFSCDALASSQLSPTVGSFGERDRSDIQPRVPRVGSCFDDPAKKPSFGAPLGFDREGEAH